MVGQFSQRRLHVALADLDGDVVQRQRRFGGEQGRLDRSEEFVDHQLFAARARTISGSNGPPCCSSICPFFASSSVAAKEEASALRRNTGSCVAGRKLSNRLHSSRAP